MKYEKCEINHKMTILYIEIIYILTFNTILILKDRHNLFVYDYKSLYLRCTKTFIQREEKKYSIKIITNDTIRYTIIWAWLLCTFRKIQSQPLHNHSSHAYERQNKNSKCCRLVPDQDVHFFYTHSHLSALHNCAIILSTNFQFIFTFK